MSLVKVPIFFANSSEADEMRADNEVITFGSFRLDVCERRLTNHGEAVPLTPKAFDLLTVLARNPGHLVTKEDLLEAVWPDSFVEEINIPRNIHTLRRALGHDDNGNRVIETVPTKGYRFVARVTNPSPGEDADADADDPPAKISDLDAKLPVPHPKRYIAMAVGFWAVAMVALWLSLGGKPKALAPSSIAILPLRPINAEKRDRDLDLAIADSIIERLSSARALRVRPLSSTWRYLDSKSDALQIGREMQVGYVLASTYQTVEGNIRVTSQLINVETGMVEGSFRSDRSLNGLFATQDALANEIASAVIDRFGDLDTDSPSAGSGSEKKSTARRQTQNEEAYKLVLQAAFILDNRRNLGSADALKLLDRAIALDPTYAKAYSARAETYRNAIWGKQNALGFTSGESYLRAMSDVQRALELDPELSSAYVILGDIKSSYEWKSDEAEAVYRRSIELDPGSAHARRYYALFLANSVAPGGERTDEALEQITTAIELDPASVLSQQILGQVLYRARRYDDAIAQMIRVRELDPNFTSGGILWLSYYLKGDKQNAYLEMRRVVESRVARKEIGAIKLRELDSAYSTGGWDAAFRYQVRSILRDGEPVFGSSTIHSGLTVAYIPLGDYEKAIDALEAGTVERNRASTVYLGPWLDPLRPHPRFQGLLKKLGY